ncbi:ubiquitin-conjugating enzyme/RWD-like protein, partial [Syncephalis pseudoplumigaleata]
ELLEYLRAPDDQIFIKYKDDNITEVRALIVGPVNTPYALGMFEFIMKFPPEYPSVPPHTTDGGQTRFNPNFYSNGKVCLSILGTWRGESGEQWSSAHGISSVLLSIQSLMTETPYENEPGFTCSAETHDWYKQHYNRKITHETIRISVCDRMETLLGMHERYQLMTQSNATASTTSTTTTGGSGDATQTSPFVYRPAMYTDDFGDICKRLFLWHVNAYLSICERECKLVKAGAHFIHMPFEGGHNIMRGQYDYARLEQRLLKIKHILLHEATAWSEASKQWIRDECGAGDNLRGQLQQIINANCLEGMDISLEDDNPYIWYISIFGKPLTPYDDGIFRLKWVFHKDFPQVWPRAVFLTPVYHCHVTADGIPYYRVKREEDIKEHLQQIAALFTDDPSPNPSTHVNSEAAALYFGTADERRQYMRSVRRCAMRSTE